MPVGCRVRRRLDERRRAEVVRDGEEADCDQEEAERGDLQRRGRARRATELRADGAARVAVGEVDREAEHEPADEAPPGGGRQVEHQEEAGHDAEHGEEPRP